MVDSDDIFEGMLLNLQVIFHSALSIVKGSVHIKKNWSHNADLLKQRGEGISYQDCRTPPSLSLHPAEELHAPATGPGPSTLAHISARPRETQIRQCEHRHYYWLHDGLPVPLPVCLSLH